MRKAFILIFFTVFLYGKSPKSSKHIFQVWQPYKFSANDYFEYELKNVNRGNKPLTGHYTVKIERVKNGYRMRIKGKYMFS